MSIIPGQPAPGFRALDVNGNMVSYQDYQGRKLLLAFFRHASCPYSRLRILRLIERYSIFKAWGMGVLGFFPSTDESIKQYVLPLQPPFPLVADPKRKLYDAYGVKSSTLGYYKSFLRLATRRDAASAGLQAGPQEETRGLLPADFLIDEDWIVQRVFHGGDITRHMPLSAIEEWLHEDAPQED